jgi:hypothetical protein
VSNTIIVVFDGRLESSGHLREAITLARSTNGRLFVVLGQTPIRVGWELFGRVFRSCEPWPRPDAAQVRSDVPSDVDLCVIDATQEGTRPAVARIRRSSTGTVHVIR